MMLNRMQLSTRYRMIPGLVSATIYRKGQDDNVATSQEVKFVEFKTPKASQSGTLDVGNRQETSLIFLWVNELKGWIVEDFDIIHVYDTTQGLDEWWLAQSSSLEQMRTRYRCECVRTLKVDT